MDNQQRLEERNEGFVFSSMREADDRSLNSIFLLIETDLLSTQGLAEFSAL